MKKGWLHFLILFVIALLGAAPILSVIVAFSIASANGCALDEGSAHACIISGHDYSELLYSMGVMGWLALATVPLAALIIFVYLLVLLVLYSVRRRKKSWTGQ
jgi:hypothetical protein